MANPLQGKGRKRRPGTHKIKAGAATTAEPLSSHCQGKTR
jgi:hypothetical protein